MLPTNNLTFGQALEEEEFLACEKILRALPDWFGMEESNTTYAKKIRELPTFYAKLSEEIVGYMTLKYLTKHSVELHLAGVLPEYQHQGIGRQLFTYLEGKMKLLGFEYWKVETLSEKALDPNYHKTRSFYYSLGFRDLEEITPYDPQNPQVVMVKKI